MVITALLQLFVADGSVWSWGSNEWGQLGCPLVPLQHVEKREEGEDAEAAGDEGVLVAARPRRVRLLQRLHRALRSGALVPRALVAGSHHTLLLLPVESKMTAGAMAADKEEVTPERAATAASAAFMATARRSISGRGGGNGNSAADRGLDHAAAAAAELHAAAAAAAAAALAADTLARRRRRQPAAANWCASRGRVWGWGRAVEGQLGPQVTRDAASSAAVRAPSELTFLLDEALTRTRCRKEPAMVVAATAVTASGFRSAVTVASCDVLAVTLHAANYGRQRQPQQRQQPEYATLAAALAAAADPRTARRAAAAAEAAGVRATAWLREALVQEAFTEGGLGKGLGGGSSCASSEEEADGKEEGVVGEASEEQTAQHLHAEAEQRQLRRRLRRQRRRRWSLGTSVVAFGQGLGGGANEATSSSSVGGIDGSSLVVFAPRPSRCVAVCAPR